MESLKVRMSSASRWINCPGSVAKNANKLDIVSPHADDGTHTHHLIDTCYKFGATSADCFAYSKLKSEAGEYTVDLERMERANVMLGLLNDYKERGYTFLTEQKAKVTIGEDTIEGTCDAVGYNYSTGTVAIIDYKDGRVKVSAENNYQLMMYACGTEHMYHYNVNRAITLQILQPRVSHKPNSVTITPEELSDFRENKLNKAVLAIKEGNAPLKSGDWCKYCLSKGDCSEYIGGGLKEINTNADKVLSDAIELTNKDATVLNDQELVDIYKSAPLITEMLKAVNAELYKRASDREVEGVKLVKGKMSRSWKLEEEEMIKKFRNLKIPLGDCHIKKLLSPNQLKSVTWKNKKGETNTLSGRQLVRFYDNYVELKEGKPLLALSEDGRVKIDTDLSAKFNPTGV